MKKLTVIVAMGVLLLALAGPVAAQEERGRIGSVFQIFPKAGMKAEFEAGFKAHMEYHQANGETWSYELYEVIAGEDRGTYIGGTFGHHWADFDSVPVSGPEDAADGAVNLTPFRDGADVWYTESLPKLSNPPPTPGQRKYVTLYTIRLKSDKVGQYMQAVEKATEGIKKTGVPLYYFVEMLVAGGTHPTIYFAVPRASYAEFAVEQEHPFDKVLAGVFGEEAAREILAQAAGAIESEKSQVLLYKPELSDWLAKD